MDFPMDQGHELPADALPLQATSHRKPTDLYRGEARQGHVVAKTEFALLTGGQGQAIVGQGEVPDHQAFSDLSRPWPRRAGRHPWVKFRS